MRYVAFLRAVNVGGRVVKMDVLRRLFTSMAFDGVATFIASGNVIFESPARNAASLESKIEAALARSLGYPVATFVRSTPDLAALAEHPLVSGATVPPGASLFVVFVRRPLSKAETRKVLEFKDDVNDFEVLGREVLWTIRGSLMDSGISGAHMEKAIGMPGTIRNATTVRRLAARYGTR